MRIKADLDDIGDARTLIDAGTYNAKLFNVEEGESSSNNPMLIWDWKITSPGTFEGETVRSWTSLQDHALFGFKQHLLALDPTLKGSINVDPEEYVGTPVVLKIGVRQYKNKEGEEATSNNIVKLTASKDRSKPKSKVSTGGGSEDGVPF